jgi:hypothetical protein
MFLLQKDIFGWDLAILMLLALTLSITILCGRWFLRSRNKSALSVLIVGLLGLFGAVGFIAVAYGSFIEPRLITVTPYSVRFPASQKLRIAVVSDLHLGPYKGEEFAKKIVREINRTLPDLVLLGGDFLFTDDASPQAIYGLRGIRAPLGTFAVIGNHDLGYSNLYGQRKPRVDAVQTVLESIGITVLRNESKVLRMPTDRKSVV